MRVLQNIDRLLFGAAEQRQDYTWLLRRQSSVVMALAMTTLATAACLVVAPVLPLLPAGLAIATGLGGIVAGWTYADSLRGRIAAARAEARAAAEAARPCYLPAGIASGGLTRNNNLCLQQGFALANSKDQGLRVSIGPAAAAPKAVR